MKFIIYNYDKNNFIIKIVKFIIRYIKELIVLSNYSI